MQQGVMTATRLIWMMTTRKNLALGGIFFARVNLARTIEIKTRISLKKNLQVLINGAIKKQK